MAAPSDDGRDPISTGCISGSYVITNIPIINQKYNEYQGTIQLMHSPNCGTNWINLIGNVAGNSYGANISKYTVAGGGYNTYVYNVGSSSSRMVYAPGTTCVYIGYSITDNASGVVESNVYGLTFC